MARVSFKVPLLFVALILLSSCQCSPILPGFAGIPYSTARSHDVPLPLDDETRIKILLFMNLEGTQPTEEDIEDMEPGALDILE